MLCIHFNDNPNWRSENIVPDSAVLSRAKAIWDEYINRSKRVDTTTMVGQEVMLLAFRKLIVQGIIPHDEIQFSYFDKEEDKLLFFSSTPLGRFTSYPFPRVHGDLCFDILSFTAPKVPRIEESNVKNKKSSEISSRSYEGKLNFVPTKNDNNRFFMLKSFMIELGFYLVFLGLFILFLVFRSSPIIEGIIFGTIFVYTILIIRKK